jgi:hypothetical protein
MACAIVSDLATDRLSVTQLSCVSGGLRGSKVTLRQLFALKSVNLW